MYQTFCAAYTVNSVTSSSSCYVDSDAKVCVVFKRMRTVVKLGLFRVSYDVCKVFNESCNNTKIDVRFTQKTVRYIRVCTCIYMYWCEFTNDVIAFLCKLLKNVHLSFGS